MFVTKGAQPSAGVHRERPQAGWEGLDVANFLASQRQGDFYGTGEARLWQEVLNETLLTIVRNKVPQKPAEREALCEARAWVADEKEWVGSFAFCCHAVGLDPDFARSLFKMVLEMDVASLQSLNLSQHIPARYAHVDVELDTSPAPTVVMRKSKAQSAPRERKARSCPGEKNGNSKLTEQDVREIRRLHATGEHRMVDLGRHFGVAQPHISRIVRGATWRIVDDATA